MTTTTDTTIATADIRSLRREAHQHGDLKMAMICTLALEGSDALEGADPGSEADLLLSAGRDQEWARAGSAA